MNPQCGSRRRLVAVVLALSPALHAAAADATPEGLEEIVVTAQKRDESVQDVPISIMAYGEETLDNFVVNEAAVYAQNLMRPKSVGGPGGLGDSLRTAYWDGSPTYGTPPAPEFYGLELKYTF